MRRAAILALSARAYGGDTYFRACLPWVDRLGGDTEYLVFVRDRRYAGLSLPNGRVRLIDCSASIGSSALRRFLWEQAALPLKLRALGVDVLYTANNLTLFTAPCPTVIGVRNLEPLCQPLANLPARLRARLIALRMLTRLSMRRATIVIAVSRRVREVVLGLGVPPDRVRLVYHGVDLPEPAPVPPNVPAIPGRFLLAAAKFVRYANLDTLIRAYHAMRETGVQEPLLIAGGPWDPRYEAEIRGLVRLLGLESWVRFLGYVEHERMLGLIRTATVFLFPSTLEACPFTLLEAMACGAAIVTTRREPMPEFAADAARYFEAGDSRGLAEQATGLLADPEARRRLGEAAVRRARVFGWERSVTALRGVLAEAAACGARTAA